MHEENGYFPTVIVTTKQIAERGAEFARRPNSVT